MSRRVLGWVLLSPALVGLGWTYVIPSVTTLGSALWRPDGRLTLHNVEYVLGSHYPGLVARATLLAAVPLVLALLVAPLLAVAALRAGRGGRLLTRVLISVPLAAYAPVVYLLAWSFGDTDAHTDRAPSLLGVAAVCVAGPVLAVAVTLYLAALRGTESEAALRGTASATALRGEGWRSGAVVGGVLAAAVVAAAIQSFTPQYVVWAAQVPRLGPQGPLAVALSARAEVQPAVSLLLLAPLTLLGVFAVWLLLRFRTRIEVAAPPEPDPHPDDTTGLHHDTTGLHHDDTGPRRGAVAGRRGGAWVLLAVTLAAFVALVVVAALPLLRVLPHALGAGDLSAATIYRETWLPPLLSAVVSVVVALLGGYALGVLRPLGDRSAHLLLLFAPWVFVGVGPLVFAHRDRAESLGLLGTWVGLVPPVWLSIPALVLFTLFFRGGARMRQVLPLAGLAVVAHWVLGAQDLLWPMLAGYDPLAHTTAPVLATVTAVLGQSLDYSIGFSLVLPLPVVLALFAVIVAAQAGYLDRLAIRTARTGVER